jgi:hypothetical protein
MQARLLAALLLVLAGCEDFTEFSLDIRVGANSVAIYAL